MDLIWERHIDPADQSARWRKLRAWFLPPAVAVVAVASFTAGVGGALGALIIVGIVGLLLVGYIVFKGLALKIEPPVHRDSHEIVCGITRVSIDQMAHWTTYIWTAREQALDWKTGGGASNVDLGVVRFTMIDGREVMLTWMELTQPEIDELRDALTPHLTAPWIARPDSRR
ncbi:MAG: hypothetical protein JK586_02975 [Nocardiopsis sp. BM-2018]|nr:MAG: hypothetical protein JK586_02975 [Nocardiopsis sp. BM-2018]